jgi:hypothetical protein
MTTELMVRGSLTLSLIFQANHGTWQTGWLNADGWISAFTLISFGDIGYG